MTTKLMASVAFGGGLGDPDFTNDIERDFDLDPDIAAAELRQAGYEVYLLPDKYHPRLAHPLDDFIEAVIVGPNDPRAFSGLTESAGFSLGWICDSTFVSNRHGGCDGQAIFSGLA